MAKYRNVDFSSPIAKEKADKKKWVETYMARQVLLAGKFTFPEAIPLTHSDASLAPAEIPLIDVKTVTFSYNTESGIWIFKDPINCTVTASTRMGVMGPNGAGKSTFLKLITDKLQPTTGEVWRHPTATVAYFAQHNVQDLDLKLTPLEYMITQFPKVEKTGLLRAHLAKVGIIGDKAETRMLNISQGLRSCVVFAKITYICPHLLIMDEPTNFLDMDSIDSLIAATNKYSGALLLVSHNRTFLNKCARQFLSVVPGKFEIFSDLKQCERATYQFIEEMESGTKVNTASLVQKNPSADASAKVRDGSVPVEKKESDGGFVLNISEHVVRDAKTEIKAKKPVAAAAPAAAAAASIPAEELKLVGSACLAVWAADGGRYPAIITKAVSKGKVEVSYNGYNEKAVLNIKDLMIKGSAKPAAASKPQQQQRRTRRGSEKA
jgi:ABC-type Mn2+/Zn2+ transport system ATPase subunit